MTPPITAQQRATVTDTVQLPQLTIAWLTPAAFTPDAYSVDARCLRWVGQSEPAGPGVGLQVSDGAKRELLLDDGPKLTGITACTLPPSPA